MKNLQYLQWQWLSVFPLQLLLQTHSLDVPAGHWAYASVAKLAAAGIVDGYPDGTFKGDNLMTRYEMAQIVAKAYAKGAIGADDKLMAEFADELDNLGARVAKLEKS